MAVLAVAAVFGLLALVVGGSEGDEPAEQNVVVTVPAPQPEPAAVPAPAAQPAPAQPGGAPDEPAGEAGPSPARPHELISLQPRRKVELWDEPGGSVVSVLKDRTEFGSVRTHWVVRRKRGWLGVTAAQIPDGRLGWIKNNPDKLEYKTTPYRLEADLSERRVRLYRGRKVARAFPVTVGAPDSPTPPGRYSVTDGLFIEGPQDAYGCCALALTGHQPNLPPGWIGGDRIAIHGTPGAIGGAASAGCLRASDADLRALFMTIPLGTPVRIRR